MARQVDVEFQRLNQWLFAQDMSLEKTINDIFFQFKPRILDLSRRRLPNVGQQRLLIRHLAYDTTLQELNLQGNQFGPLLEALVSAILNNPASNLHTLILRDNAIAGKDCIHVARLLGRSTKLQRLDIAYNRLGEDPPGVANMIVALRSNAGSALQQIDLSFNQIACLPPNELIAALRQHPALNLNFSGNPVFSLPEMAPVIELLRVRPRPGPPAPPGAAPTAGM
eukprot:RCo050497